MRLGGPVEPGGFKPEQPERPLTPAEKIGVWVGLAALSWLIVLGLAWCTVKVFQSLF